MDRRGFLRLCGAAPVVALATPAEARAVAPALLNKWAGPNPMAVEEDYWIPGPKLGWMEMAEKLNANLDRFIAEDEARHNVKWDEKEVMHQKAICYRMCHYLTQAAEKDDPYSPVTFIEDMMQQFYPDVPREILKTVRFEVSDSPIAVVAHPDTQKLVSAPCQARRVKLRYSPEVAKDLAAFCGIDAEVELISAWGQEVALEIALEICQSYKEGKPIKVYAFYMPPFLGAKAYPYTPKDFSSDRRCRMRYAKFF